MGINHYHLMVPPFEFVPFEKMNKKQAKEYFDWFILQTESRILELQAYAKLHGITHSVFDDSIRSLIPVWEWYESQITLTKKSPEEIQRELIGRPKWMHGIIEQSTERLSDLTIATAIDLSFYFAKVFLIHNPSISWGIRTKPKSLASVNRPVLTGFIKDMILDPSRIVIVSAEKSSRAPFSTRLLDLYQTWLGFIEL